MSNRASASYGVGSVMPPCCARASCSHSVWGQGRRRAGEGAAAAGARRARAAGLAAFGDAAPADARKVDINMSELRVDYQVVLPLANGLVAATERDASGVLPKLKAALGQPRAPPTLRCRSTPRCRTRPPRWCSTRRRPPACTSCLQVRKPGASTATGWLAVDSSRRRRAPTTTSRSPSVQGHKWDEFTAAWQAVYDACRGSQTGSCACPGQHGQGAI